MLEIATHRALKSLRRYFHLPATDSVEAGKNRALALRIATLLERDLQAAGIEGLHVYVNNGTVTLFGARHTALDATLIVSLMKQIPGVHHVVTHFGTLPADKPPTGRAVA